jgi:hypothetical protein
MYLRSGESTQEGFQERHNRSPDFRSPGRLWGREVIRPDSGSLKLIWCNASLGGQVAMDLPVELFGIKSIGGLVPEQFLNGFRSEW